MYKGIYSILKLRSKVLVFLLSITCIDPDDNGISVLLLLMT